MNPMEAKMADLPEPPFKQMREEQEEPEESEVKIDDLPILPFEKILSYLDLENRIKARAVSRYWRDTIDSFRVKTLCVSDRPMGFVYKKSRLISSAFASNFMHSPRIESFFSTFGQSILSSLKHLRLCDLHDYESITAFARALNSFTQLVELNIIQFDSFYSDQRTELELNLPMLNSIHLEEVYGISKLTLDAPRLQKVKLGCSSGLKLDLVHGESVERLLTSSISYTEVKRLRNLKHLYISDALQRTNSTLLADLKQLKEICLCADRDIPDLFEQKQRYGRTDLKIFFRGFLLNGRDDPEIDSLLFRPDEESLVCLAENPSRLVDEIPFIKYLKYNAIERVAPESAINLLCRFTELNEIFIDEPVQDIQRFLDLLRHFSHIVCLFIRDCDQPQDLFDRLPEHCAALQELDIWHPPENLSFLFKLKNLISLFIDCSIDTEFIRKVLQELELLSQFSFQHINKHCKVAIDHHLKRIEVSGNGKEKVVSDLDAAIQFITENALEEE